MKVEIVDYDKKLHENFVKSYTIQYINHGIIYDCNQDKKNLLISKILAELDVLECKLAVNADNKSEFLGFILYENHIMPRMRFIYVKKQYQRKKIGSLLLDNSMDFVIPMITMPCKTPSLNLFLKAKGIKPLIRFFEVIKGE